MWIAIGLVLLALWALGFVVFKVASFAIHLLVLAAVVAVVLHFVRRFRHHGTAGAG